MEGRSISCLIPPDRSDELPEILSRIMGGERVDHYETVRVRKDGRNIDVSLTISPIKDAEGKILGFSKISRDITEHKRLEEYILRTERLAAMGRIIAVLAHEFKNPLQAIQSNLELVRDFRLDPDEREDSLRSCYQEAERLNELIQRMLVFSHTEPYMVYPISIPKIWQQALAYLSKSLQQSTIQVTADFPEDLPHVLGAADQIRQVFANLVLKSLESMPEGGEIHTSARVEGEIVILNLWNNGPPIPAEHLEHIFEPFFTTKPDNTGLDLFIAHNIVLQHGGTIRVENLEEDAGVLFTFTLPASSASG
jgi:signal transduction histidine kinase